MKTLLSVMLALASLHTMAQHVRIDTLKLSGMEGKNTLRYPVISTGNKKVDSLINFDMKNRYTAYEFMEDPIKDALAKWAEDGIAYMEFRVTFKQSGMLSLNISTEGCGASCTSWTRYFNYSTTTGNFLQVVHVIDTTGRFREMVLKDKNTQFEKHRTELRKLLNDKSSGVDNDTFDWVTQQIDECNRAFTLETFALHADRLEIIAFCDLPNAIRNLSPEVKLSYKYADIAPYMRVKVR